MAVFISWDRPDLTEFTASYSFTDLHRSSQIFTDLHRSSQFHSFIGERLDENLIEKYRKT